MSSIRQENLKYDIMKKIKIVFIALLWVPLILNAQEDSVELFTVPLSNPGSSGKLIVEQLAGSIDVMAYEGAEVIVKASFGNDNRRKDKKEKDGLKRIENSSMKISAEEKNNTVQIINEQWNKPTNLEIKVPVNFSLKLGTVNKGNITVHGVKGEFEISNVNGEITVEDVSGSVSADTVNGDIKVNFISVNSGASMAFSSMNGDLEVTFPSTTKADLKLKSEMGDIFTDFDMALDKQKPVVDKNNSGGKYKVKIEQWVNGSINGGGPEMLFKTFNGYIIFR
ncbi:DUF4097 family beta strand repeat-containing protein [Maribacter algicola]|uniref:DUF4097 family beta strand repeat-containing protein n=1 Tax=Meishania litoralis TaxID=3434685 RepID=A0ACC7LFJ1_9FLAO